jgi:hypothetical protein
MRQRAQSSIWGAPTGHGPPILVAD